MPLLHENSEPSGGTLTYIEWNGPHSISAGSFEVGSNTIYFTDCNLYRYAANTIGTNDSVYIAGNLVVAGTMTGTSGGGFNAVGGATILPGSLYTAITHGYGGTPDMVVLTALTDTGGKRIWVNKTSTQFTITIDSAYSSTIIWDWGTA